MKTISLFLLLLIIGCTGSVIPPDPLKALVKENDAKAAYTITLQDMDLKDNKYQHKYKIFELGNSASIKVKETDWKPVSVDFFALHENDLGMELISKFDNGKYNNLVTPPGFTHFIGNPTYGDWSGKSEVPVEDPNQVWLFKPEFKKLEEDLGIKGLAINKAEYDQFKEDYLLNRPFYGETKGDSTKYGTRSHFWLYSRPLFYSRRSATRNFMPTNRSRGYSRGGGGFGK